MASHMNGFRFTCSTTVYYCPLLTFDAQTAEKIAVKTGPSLPGKREPGWKRAGIAGDLCTVRNAIMQLDRHQPSCSQSNNVIFS